jgi:hypothetical protein
MKKFILIIAVAFAFFASVNLNAQFQDLDNDMYLEINNYNDLYTLSQNEAYWVLWFELTTDIRIPSGQNFNPIGVDTCPFTGIFHGHNYKIIGMEQNYPNRNAIGLFGVNLGIITDLIICNFDVIGNNQVGALCGLNGGEITECEIYFDELYFNFSPTIVTGRSSVGGMIGGNWGSVVNCKPTLYKWPQYPYVVVNGLDTTGGFVGDNNWYDNNEFNNNEIYNAHVICTANGQAVGGFVGFNDMDISNCYVRGFTTINDTYSENGPSNRFGGFVGYNLSPITNCVVGDSVVVDAIYTNDVGGFAGRNWSDITFSNTGAAVEGKNNVGGFSGIDGGYVSNCHSSGSVSADYFYVGGFVGQFLGDMAHCYVTETAIVSAIYSDHVGGFVGRNEGDIQYCCTKAVSVEGDDNVGGFVGSNISAVYDCYSRANVSGAEYVGGFVGINLETGDLTRCLSACSSITGSNPGGFAAYNINGWIVACRWDAELCNNLWSDGGEARSTYWAKHYLGYASWDYNFIWEFTSENDGYPSFRLVPNYKVNYPNSIRNIEIYPNPVSDVSTINLTEPENGFTTISVYNAIGEKIETLYSGNINANEYTIDFNGNNYTSGMYYMVLESNNSRIIEPIVVKH